MSTDNSSIQAAGKPQALSPVTVRELAIADVGSTVRVLQRMRAAAEDYPPHSDVGAVPAALTSWLMEGSSLIQLVALDRQVTVGHVRLVEPHDYLVSRAVSLGLPALGSSWGEVVKPFVDSAYRHRGVGALLMAALREHASALERTLVLAVIKGSPAATSFYQAHQFVPIGTFVGRHGVNQVFVDEYGITSAVA